MRVPWCVLLACVLGTASAAAAPQWQALPAAPTWGRFDGLHFVDADTGWVCNGPGQIYRTTDGGASWELQYEELALYFRSIGFADAQRGWAGALYTPAILYGTANGGEDWAPVPNIPEPRPIAICGISVPSSQVVYCVGSFAGPARMTRSTDGGATWTSSEFAPLASTAVDVFFKSDSEGFVVGSVGDFPDSCRSVVLHTTDGGASWRPRHVGARRGEWGWKISFPTPSVGYVSLERFAGPMFVLKTTDGGLTWSELPFPDYNEQGVGFLTPEIGWIGGGGNPANPTFGTTDGGATWTPTPWGEDLDRFQFFGPTLGYASGATVYKYSEGPLAVAGGTAPRRGSLAAPNPFVSRTTIRFSLEESRRVRLLIVDPVGRVVRRLEDGTRGAGPHVVTWDGKDDRGGAAAPGIYLYILRAGERHEIGKLVRVR